MTGDRAGINESGSSMTGEGKTKILGFLCNWCAYAGADLAGVSRVQYPPDMRVIRVMCSGRIDPILVLKAFGEGSDGVAILGCHPGDCHYQIGNYQAERKVRMTLKVLEKIGIEPERLLLDWVSAAEGTRFGEVVAQFTGRIRDLGPIDRAGDFRQRMALGRTIIESERIRWLVGKELELIEEGNVYHEKVNQDEFTEILTKNIDREYDRGRIRAIIEDTPRSVDYIAGELNMPPPVVFSYLTEMENNGSVTLMEIQGKTPFYQKIGFVEEEGGE
jgi:coenzyme F420-reducing hydrogenase delta subunit